MWYLVKIITIGFTQNYRNGNFYWRYMDLENSGSANSSLFCLASYLGFATVDKSLDRRQCSDYKYSNVFSLILIKNKEKMKDGNENVSMFRHVKASVKILFYFCCVGYFVMTS